MNPIVVVPSWLVKSVYVRKYTRFRFGRIEWVVQHYRSWPRR